MAACAPQRFLANNRNEVRTATLDPSTVLAIENGVLTIPTARTGTAQVKLTGSYTGVEEATYDIEILDDDVDTPLISAPIFSGEGSERLEDIAADAIAQEITVELAQSGLPLLFAAIDLEGATVEAREGGATGNAIFLEVDQSGLTYTAQAYSLLHELRAGAGGTDSPLTGSEYDYDTAILGADGAIPLTAHRVAFGNDQAIYLQYKSYKDGDWSYHFAPALKRDVPQGTIVKFVTGGRSVTVSDGVTPEVYPDIVTLYDLLAALKTNSALVNVTSVVANDRSPTGQASHELQTRTDAHFDPSYGEGSDAATGFVDLSVDPTAGTQLVVATCKAVQVTDHPLAGVGRERWELKSSLLGVLGTIVTGEPFAGAEFGLTIPIVLPYEYGQRKGRFEFIPPVRYMARGEGEDPPPICPVALTLGPNAVDQTLTLVWTKRPSGDCVCSGLPVPNLDTTCLGNSGLIEGESMAYQADTIERLRQLREWFADTVRSNSEMYDDTGSPVTGVSRQDYYLTNPSQFAGQDESHGAAVWLSLLDVVNRFETTLAQIDPLEGGSPSYRTSGFDAWTDAFEELQADIAAIDASTAGMAFNTQTIASDRYVSRLAQVLITAGISPLGEFDASPVTSGDGCWRDWGDAYYWTVTGTQGQYAPAFANHPYYSSRRATEADAYFSTKEFAFQINVKCVEDLLEGDEFTLAIGGAGQPATYQVGDQLFLPIIAAQNLYLAGGRDASLVELWYVNGSVSGAFPTFSYDPDAPTPYSVGSPSPLSFTLVPGGIPSAKGDRFAFTVEGGHYRWRKNAGTWEPGSPPEDIPAGAVAFDDGLLIEFIPGVAPSFVAGDTFSFRALQPWAVSNVQTPGVEPWKWDEADPTIVIDSGAPVASDMLTIALHTIPEGATITIEGGDVAGVYTWTESVTWREGVIAHLHDETRTSRYRRLSLTDADGGGIGWLWSGMALSTELSATVTPHRKYSLSRGDGGLYTRGRYLGKGRGAEVVWPEGALSEDDIDGLATMLDSVKQHDDEPLVFVANVSRLAEASLVQVVDDEFEESDTSDSNRDAAYERRFRGQLTLGAVLQ